jgi:acyl carrier protein
MSSSDGPVVLDPMIDWLTTTVARYAEMDRNKVDPDKPFSDYGLDSVSAFAIVTDIEDSFGLVPDVTIVWDYPTVRALARHLAESLLNAHTGQ